MANTYQQNDVSGSGFGYVKYSITPDFGQPIFPGDTVIIDGTAYCRDYAIKSISVSLGLSAQSSSAGFSKNVSIAKGKTGKFNLTFNMPKISAGEGRIKKIYPHFDTYDLPNEEYKNGGVSTYGNENQTINYLDYKLLPKVLEMDFDRANIDGTWSNEGLYFQCRIFKISVGEDATAKDITKATIVSKGSDGSTKTVNLNSSQIASALSGAGYTETSPKIFTDASLIGATYTLTLTIGDDYEQVVYTDTVPRAFANMHLSGASTGGVAFGMFSTATESNPKLESAYPAHLYGGFGDETIKLLSNVIYPVGSVFFCTDEITPTDVFGGTWEQIKDRFIVAAGDSYLDGDTGGSGSYLLSGKHKHLSPAGFSSGILGVVRINDARSGGSGKSYASANADHSGTLGSDISLAYTMDTTLNETIPTIPPYIAVCVWKRTGLYDVDADMRISNTMKSIRRLSHEQLEDK